MRGKLFLMAVIFVAIVVGGYFLTAGDFAPKVALTGVISEQLRLSFLEQLNVILEKVLEIQRQLSEIISRQEEELSKALELEAATTTEPEVPEVLEPLKVKLDFNILFPSITLSSYGVKTLNEFKILSDEKVAITKIRFTNVKDLADEYLKNFKLIDSSNHRVLAEIMVPIDKMIEFKIDENLMVSGGTYYVQAEIITPVYGSLNPKIRLDIASASDITAVDYDNPGRPADISGSDFPIVGPTITTF